MVISGVVYRCAPTTAAGEHRFAQTGKCVVGLFAQYWAANGGLAQQGYPITDEFDEVSPTDGRTYRTQYFERARFEYHPENAAPYTVLLGLLGHEQYLARYPDGRPAGGTSTESDVCFEATGRCIRGVFYRYWAANGGLAQQGYPLSEEFEEASPTDGKTYGVQYFERARFEYHPENAGSASEVLLGLLGREQFVARHPGGQPSNAQGPNAHEEQIARLMQQSPEQRRPSLTYPPILGRVARERAADMATRRYFGHTDPDGLGPNTLVRRAGYVLPAFYSNAPDGNNIEAIAAGAATAEAAWELWMSSPPHRTHILGLQPFYAEQIEYGIGYAHDPASPYRHYWVILTAKRGP